MRVPPFAVLSCLAWKTYADYNRSFSAYAGKLQVLSVMSEPDGGEIKSRTVKLDLPVHEGDLAVLTLHNDVEDQIQIGRQNSMTHAMYNNCGWWFMSSFINTGNILQPFEPKVGVFAVGFNVLLVSVVAWVREGHFRQTLQHAAALRQTSE